MRDKTEKPPAAELTIEHPIGRFLDHLVEQGNQEHRIALNAAHEQLVPLRAGSARHG